jgi:hypothetical protein
MPIFWRRTEWGERGGKGQPAVSGPTSGRLRQRLCGLCLLAACLPARATSSPQGDATANVPAARAAAAASNIAATTVEPTAPRAGVLASLKQRAMAWLPHFSTPAFGKALPAPQALQDNLRALGEKYGMHIAPPDPGYVYLDVLRKIDDAAGNRWALQSATLEQTEAHDRAWQPNGLQDLSKPDRNSLREVRFVPQLIMNVNQMVDVPGQLQLGMTYRSWDCPDAGALPDMHPVPQMSLRWTYR